MFYALSKLAWLILEPFNFLLLLMVFGLVLYRITHMRSGILIVSFSLLTMLIVSIFPIGHYLLAQLEYRFPKIDELDTEITGIIVLGGFVDGELYERDKWSGFESGVARIIGAGQLSHRFKKARVIFTGGPPISAKAGTAESEVAEDVFKALGVNMSRVSFERNSRNTAENAAFSKQIAIPQNGDHWLLVTSAYHMPRAIGSFRAAGFPVHAYPVDFIANKKWPPHGSGTRGLVVLGYAVHEFLGLVAYRLNGMTSELFPAP